MSVNGSGLGPNTASFVETSTCQDFTGRPIVDSDFLSNQIHRDLVLDGSASGRDLFNRPFSVTFNKYPVTTTGAVFFVTEGPLPNIDGWYLSTVARTNPSRPVLTPLTIIQDFVELPVMLRDIPKLLQRPKRLLTAKELANQNLAVQFGWLPFISDINQLLDLQSAVLRRQKELQQLYSGRGLRRRIKLGDDSRESSVDLSFSIGIGINVLSTHALSRERKAWATIHWKPSSPPAYHPSTDELNRQARRIVLGLTPEGLAKGAWDVIPWTWLIGWFTNVGDYLLAFSNTVPAAHTSACLMEYSKNTISGKSVQITFLNDVHVRYLGAYTQESRRRTVSGSLTPGFSMPFIGIRRLSILSSLFIQRFLR